MQGVYSEHAAVGTVNGIAICIFPEDHLPIHVHARANGIDVRVYLDTTLTVTSKHGMFSATQLRIIKAWVGENVEPLRANWARINR